MGSGSGGCSKKLKTCLWILTILLLCYYRSSWFGLIVQFIGPGLRNVLYQDTSGGSGQGGGGVGDDPQPLPLILFKQTFTPKVQEEMSVFSEEVQRQLVTLNTGLGRWNKNTPGGSKNFTHPCHGPKIRCGSPLKCEIGCQIHGMMTCLIISYTTNRTLVPTWNHWPYTDQNHKWGHLFQPLGFNCPFDRDTGIVTWHKSKIEITTRDLLEYPFSSGFTIPEEIGVMAKRHGIDIFHWWAGQFAKFALRLHPLQEKMMSKTKAALKFSSTDPIVGILVRRRDKLGERRKTRNFLDKYMSIAKKYFSKVEQNLRQSQMANMNGNGSSPSPLTRRIYLGTDDKSLLMLARKQYPSPKWEILGVVGSDPEDILKDLVILSQCQFVLCSFSSDICRLVSELMESKELGGGKRVKSLDYPYFYDIPDLVGAKTKTKFNLL